MKPFFNRKGFFVIFEYGKITDHTSQGRTK